ncbi:synaptotagmin-like protein 2 isoform X7 [Urocitellus parryii]
MIDLSFLTEEEQEAIMKVLQRDAALKRTEEERVRHLPEKIKDDQQLKNMSGQWFYEAKAKRHRDKIHGADIIRASMRKKRLQVATEQSKDRATEAKESWVNNVNKDAFPPPELAGAVEEPKEDGAPPSPSPSVVNPASTVIDMTQENTKKSTGSPAKQRKNPFNSPKLPEDHLSPQTQNEQSKNGRAGLFQISKEGELPESKEKSSISDISSQKLDKSKQTVLAGPVNGSQIKAPVPKARKFIYKSDGLKQDDKQSFPRQRSDSMSARGAPRGILKRNSSSSSTDSETLRLSYNFEPKSKIVSSGLTIHERISEKEHSLEDDSFSNSLEPLKHVRFSAVKDELPQSPGLIHGREVGEFSVLESDRSKNGTEDAGDSEFQDDPKPSQYRKPFLPHQSASSPSGSKNEAYQPTISGSVPNNGPHSPLEVLTARPQTIENLPTTNKHQAKASELTRLESELSPNPADELSHCVEPEPSQVPDCSSRDHQQGKLPLLATLKAKTSSRSGPYATEIKKTTDDSITKVLDWFNRSSNSDDSKSSFQHPRGIEPKGKTDSKSQVAIAMVTDDTSLKENDLKALSFTKVKLKPVKFDSTFQEDGDMLVSEHFQDNAINIRPKSMNLSQQDTPKEGPVIPQPFASYGTSSQGSKNMDNSQRSKSTEEGNGVPLPTNNCPYSVLKDSNAEVQVSCNTKNIRSLGKEELKLHVHEKYTGNSKVDFDSSAIVQEPNLKDDVKAERRSKEGNTSILKASLETENRELLPGIANSRAPSKKPEVHLQQEADEVPKNQVLREKYKRVSDRISFWEGEKAAAELTYEEPTSSCSQEQSTAKANQPVRPQDIFIDSLSTDQSEYGQFTAKRVVFDEDDQASHLSSFHSSNKPKETSPQISGLLKHHPSADQSNKMSLFQNKTNKHIKSLLEEDGLHSRRDITLPALQHPSNIGNEIHTSLEKDRFPIGESNANFKIMSLKERMDEPNTEQVYNHSQFENLRKFWDLGANPNNKNNSEKSSIISQKNSVSLTSQKCKEFSDIKSSGRNTHQIEVLFVMPRGEMEKLNSKCIIQVLPNEATFPSRPPGKSIHHSAENESSKENNMKCFGTPVFKEAKDYLDQEIQESTVKEHVLSKDCRDTFSDSVQKLVSEGSSPAIQPSGREAHGKQILEPGISEDGNWLQNTDFADDEKEAKGPKEIIDEHVDKTVMPPKVKQNTLAASLDKLLKEATGISHSPLQTKLEPLTTGTDLQLEEDRSFEKGIKLKGCQREIIAPSSEGFETLANTALIQKAESGEFQFNTDNLLQMGAESSPPLHQPSHLHRKGSFEDVANSPQDMPFSWDAHFAPQDRALPSQREISETVERVILPSKPALNDVNAVLKKLLREAWLSNSAREVGSEEVKAEFPEGVQAAGSPPNSLGAIPLWATMDTIIPETKDFYSFTVVPDKTHEVGSHLTTQISEQLSESEQLRSSSVSTLAQYDKDLPQEVAEIVRETIIKPKSEFLEFTAGLEKLHKETLETSPSRYEKDTGTHSPADLLGSTEAPRQAASKFHPKEIEEIVVKAEVPSITESAFDIGFEKLLKEISEAPPHWLQVSVKEEIPEEEPSQSEKSGFWAEPRASEMKGRSNGLESQVKQIVKVLGGDEVVSDSSVLCGSASGVEIPGTPPLYVDHEIETIRTISSPEDRDNKSDVAGELGTFQEPGFEEAPKESVSKSEQPVSLLTKKENPTKISKVELKLTSPYKRQVKKQEKEGFSDSDFSDGNTGSNAESWRNTSSSEEEPSPVLKALERSAARKMPSKSLEDISSDLSNQAKVDNLPEELVRSAEDVSTVPSQPDNLFSHPDKFKRMSKSVPAFLQDETAPVALEAENRGEMKLALQYVPEPTPGKKLPTTGEVHIWVKECLDLPPLRGSHLNSFVKCTILPDTSRKSRQKTRAVGKTTNPIFNHTMVYDGFRPEDLMEACVELTVWDHYKLTNQFLGGLRIGFGTGKSYGTEVDWMDSTSEEVALWEKMVNSPNTWIEATLPLRMLLIAKISK